MTATDELRKLLDERGVEWGNVRNDGYESDYLTKWRINGIQGHAFVTVTEWPGGLTLETFQRCPTPEQAVAATLGRPKVKAHPYGYEPDTGAFDVTRCECGCLNDISATYCNDCGGEIEIDMNAEKEIYHCLRHLVFVEKHDDGSLEFGGKRYIAKGDA